MAAVTRLGLHGGPRGLYGDFSGKAAAAVQLSGSTGFAWAPTGDLDVEATLAGSTGFAWAPTGDLDVESTLAGSTGFTWTPTGNLVDTSTVTAVRPTGGWGMAGIYDRYREERREREEEERAARKAIKEIEDETDSEIARLMHKRLAYEARTQEIKKLEAIMKRFDDRQMAREYNADVVATYERAMKAGTFAAAEAFERAMDRAREEEEFLLLAIATLH